MYPPAPSPPSTTTTTTTTPFAYDNNKLQHNEGDSSSSSSSSSRSNSSNNSSMVVEICDSWSWFVHLQTHQIQEGCWVPIFVSLFVCLFLSVYRCAASTLSCISHSALSVFLLLLSVWWLFIPRLWVCVCVEKFKSVASLVYSQTLRFHLSTCFFLIDVVETMR